MTSESDQRERTSQFRIADVLLLTAGVAYALGILVPIGGREPNGQFVAVGTAAGLTALGTAISYPIWRFLLPWRLTPLAVNHVGYLLPFVALGIVWDDDLFGAMPLLARGPLNLFGYTYGVTGALPVLRGLPEAVYVVGLFAIPMLLLMLTSTVRRNWIGVVLTSLGTALWYLAGFFGALSRMP